LSSLKGRFKKSAPLVIRGAGAVHLGLWEGKGGWLAKFAVLIWGFEVIFGDQRILKILLKITPKSCTFVDFVGQIG